MQNENETPTPEQQPVPRKRGWGRDLRILGMVLLVVVAFVTGLTMRGGGGGDGHDHAPAGAAADQVHTCPMHPEIRNQGPGKCPICGMDLVPMAREEEGDLGPRQLALSPRAKALLNVQTAPVQRLRANAELRLTGKVEADETRVRAIASRVPARIEKLFVDYTGTTVKQGAPLVAVYSPELVAAQEELLQAAAFAGRAQGDEALAGTARANVRAAREKLRLWGLSSGQIAAIEKGGRASERLTITAPIGGVVLEKDAREGEYVAAGQRIYTIADLSQVWVQLDAYESDLARIREGAPVTLTTQAAAGKRIEGKVAFVSPTLDERTRTVRVRVNVPNREGHLKPGTFVQAVLRAEPTRRDAAPLVIPATAPLLTGRRAVVYVEVPDRDRPTYEGRDVVLGARLGEQFVVESGLEAGELVVTNGNFRLDAELQLRGRPSMMAPEGDGAGGHDHGGQAAGGGAGGQERGGPAPGSAGGHEHGGPAGSAESAAATPERLEVPAEFSRQIGQVVEAQFALVKALSDDEPEHARAAGAKTREALARVDMSLVKGAAHDLWMGSQHKMNEALQRLAARERLEEQRREFERFSDELTRAVRWFGTGDVGPVFRAMCPMVENKREGYWLQPQREVTNPYWGEMMYSCGEITETIAEGGHGR
jgi:membrane fusion protein, copper/silver efflux system